jgi:hypothetical protein
MNRIEESINIIKQIQELGIPTEYPPLKELSARLSDYIKSGEPWAGKIKFEAYKRVADVILPRRQDRHIVVILKAL